MRSALVLLCLLLAGCAMKVIDLDPFVESPVKADPPFAAVVVVEDLQRDPDRWDDAGSYQHGLRHAMREAHLFRRVAAPADLDFTPDLIVRGRVQGHFEYNGFLNFLTWFPGPFLLMHNWRGNRYEYEAQADVDLIDPHTEALVHHYEVQSRHELIHRSGNPFPIFGAALVFPGLIRGATNAKPRSLYRETLYESAYPALWREVIEAIRVERAPYYAARRKEQAGRCGDGLNGRPVVGVPWADFVSCQTAAYHAREEKDSPEGVETIYTNNDGSLEIHVIDGRIVRWMLVDHPAE